ncbi:MAG: HAD family hydrolase [Spirochaetales bacterium]|nr:HAD family hydrolase [Spirochaetales bacterium]
MITRKMKSQRQKGIIFDLDGTLVDTLGDIAAAMNRVLRDLGFPPHLPEAYKRFVGYGLRETARRALPEEVRNGETARKAGELLIRYYGEDPITTTKPYPGIQEMLQGLHEKGFPLAVLSNKAHDLVEQVVRDVLRGFPFVAVQGAEDGYPMKPDPSSAKALSSRMGLKPQELLFVGDSEVDIITGRSSGMVSAAVAWGFRSTAELKEAGAEVVFRRPEGILRWMTDQRKKGGA